MEFSEKKEKSKCVDEDLILQKPHEVKMKFEQPKSKPNRGMNTEVANINTKNQVASMGGGFEIVDKNLSKVIKQRRRRKRI